MCSSLRPVGSPNIMVLYNGNDADGDRAVPEHRLIEFDDESCGSNYFRSPSSLVSRRNALRQHAIFSLLPLSVLLATTGDNAAWSCYSSVAHAAADIADSSTKTIRACKKEGNAPANCVSTASVKQVDLYVSPWTFSTTNADDVAARLKGVIASDPTLELVERSDDNRYFRVRAARNFCFDELEFVINDTDKVVTFRSQQVEGPDINVSDFSANRKRLEDIRKRTEVLDVMGAEFDSADSGPREGVGGQLKAFWGLQSGGGYESILLDDE